MDWCIFVFGGVSFVYMCDLVVDWVRLCSWGSVVACVYMCAGSVLLCVFILFCVSCVPFLFSLFLCVLWLVMTLNSQ